MKKGKFFLENYNLLAEGWAEDGCLQFAIQVPPSSNRVRFRMTPEEIKILCDTLLDLLKRRGEKKGEEKV